MSRLAAILCLLYAMLTQCHGGCVFPTHWSGRWFQSGVQSLLSVNSTHMETKGECHESSSDYYILHDRSDDCYRCVVIYEKHEYVLQYKESYCDRKAPLDEICGSMVGDAPLYSMFRVEPRPTPQPCPFRGAPFSFTYNKGTGECTNPPSKAESCTDDSRLLLKYQACPDVHATESNVEELVCLATWKEGFTAKYLVGKISQVNRRIDSNEESYRCFVYQRNHHNGKVTYDIAQSADATCNGLLSIKEGSKTMKLTSVDNQHNRCRFPNWITDHHKWHSLDHKKIYHFSHKNATLKISDEISRSPPQPFLFGLNFDEQKKPSNIEMRLVCHSILQSIDNKKVQIVAHVTEGCNSGHICMVFNKRDSGVIEVQQSSQYEDNADEACRYFDQAKVPFTTLITSTLQPRSCPHAGRYHVNINALENTERRKRRQQSGIESSEALPVPVECTSRDYESLNIGCSTNDEMMEFKSACSSTAYTCHGSWQENGIHYLIAAPISRKSNDVRRFCFIYTQSGLVDNESSTESQLGQVKARQVMTHPMMHLSVLTESCHRDVIPGQTAKAFNLTSNGTCAESSSFSNIGPLQLALPLLVCSLVLLVTLITRR